MADHSTMKLGRKAIRTDSRTLALAKYLKPGLPAAPPACDWTKGITSWGAMLNDKLRCCTISGVAHAIQVWSANLGEEMTVSDNSIQKYYEEWAGYNPKDASTDQGGIELDVLNDWKKQDFCGHKLIAYADPKYTELEEIRQSIALFGGVYVGMALPLSAQKQDVWDVVASGGHDAKKGTWGGHCVFVPKYDGKTFTCITWGEMKTMTVAFWNEYCDEAHTLLGNNWMNRKGAPSGFNHTQLLADLALIK